MSHPPQPLLPVGLCSSAMSHLSHWRPALPAGDISGRGLHVSRYLTCACCCDGLSTGSCAACGSAVEASQQHALVASLYQETVLTGGAHFASSKGIKDGTDHGAAVGSACKLSLFSASGKVPSEHTGDWHLPFVSDSFVVFAQTLG